MTGRTDQQLADEALASCALVLALCRNDDDGTRALLACDDLPGFAAHLAEGTRLLFEVLAEVDGRLGRRGRGTLPPDFRQMSRRWLRGQLDAGYERMPSEQPLTYRDGCANQWLAAQTSAANVAALVDEQIGLGPLYERVDAVEVEAWSSFVARVRELAGE
jgi:hypothetical protein